MASDSLTEESFVDSVPGETASATGIVVNSEMKSKAENASPRIRQRIEKKVIPVRMTVLFIICILILSSTGIAFLARIVVLRNRIAAKKKVKKDKEMVALNLEAEEGSRG
jgi:hypothetical protein